MLLKVVTDETVVIDETPKQRKTEALKRLQVVESFREGNLNRENLPEWMIMKGKKFLQ